MNPKQTGNNQSVADTFDERHFTIAEIAARWGISREKARRLFHDEPGVIRFHQTQKHTRQYNTYRVPESVARRVRARMMNV